MKYAVHSFIIVFVSILSIFLLHVPTYAQDKQVLSVTPPLFQVSVLPGGIWQSTIKVVNSNSYPLTVYAEVVNFEASGERGQGTFIPVTDTDEKLTLAEWITVSSGPHTIQPEQSKDITFFVEVPDNAPPGGHYAAVLISTEPPRGSGTIALHTSQTVTSLFFLRIEGDVIEQGTIREFRVIDTFLSRPEVEFSLRFENKGNVHLQPKGNIVITNMWGTERGVIPINQRTHFGNVLPQSIRDFKFLWKSEFQLTDIGRYKAEVALVYGEKGMKTETGRTYFWVIPIKGTVITLSLIIFFLGCIVLMVKMYVRKMLLLAGVDIHTARKAVSNDARTDSKKESTALNTSRSTYRTVSAPIRNGVLDLRTQLRTTDETIDVVTTIFRFIFTYKIFFMSVLVLIGIFISMALYIAKVTETRHDYEVVIDEGDTLQTLHGSELSTETRDIEE